MEFLLYLSPASQEIYQMISRKVMVVENTPICRKHDIFGFFDSKKNIMTFCTSKIKLSGETHFYVNETLLHESVHIAQSCKSKNGKTEPFGILASSMELNIFRKNSIDRSVKTFGEQIRKTEHEAYWMEDKPDKVKYVVQKYCF